MVGSSSSIACTLMMVPPRCRAERWSFTRYSTSSAPNSQDYSSAGSEVGTAAATDSTSCGSTGRRRMSAAGTSSRRRSRIAAFAFGTDAEAPGEGSHAFLL